MCGLVLATVTDGGGMDVDPDAFWTVVVVIIVLLWLRELLR